MAEYTCTKCGKSFCDGANLRRHLQRKTPCEPILDTPSGASKAISCKYCGRAFSSRSSMYRHVRQYCKIANTDEGMEKLMDHTLQKQVARVEAQNTQMAAQIAELAKLVKSQASQLVASGAPQPSSATMSSQHAAHGSTIINGPVTQIHVDKVEIRPWDSSRALSVDVAAIAAAFTENARLREYARLPDRSLTDPEIAPPYVTELLTDLVRRGHADPAARNIYLNPRRADQVLVQLKGGSWEVRGAIEGIRALVGGVATSIHEVTLTHEKRKQLPLEAQNALAMAGLLYDDEPEAYVERAKSTLVAHLANMAPPPRR